MSVQALGWVFDHSPTKGTDRLVLLSLANYANKSPHDGAWESWPGVATIQREAGLDRKRTVMDALARLVAGGHVEREINGAPDTRIRLDRRPNLYRILLGNGETCGDARCVWCGETPERERGDATTYDGETRGDVTGRRDASPEPLVEPSLEPERQPNVLPVASDGDLFERFWLAYPKARRLAKPDAKAAFKAAIKKAPAEQIIDAVRRYDADPNRLDEYTPYPQKWLKQERWNAPPEPRRNGASISRAREREARTRESIDKAFGSSADQLAIGGPQ